MIRTVGELRRALEGVPDSAELVIRTSEEDGHSFCGGVVAAGLELPCCAEDDDAPFFALDCTDEEFESEPAPTDDGSPH